MVQGSGARQGFSTVRLIPTKVALWLFVGYLRWRGCGAIVTKPDSVSRGPFWRWRNGRGRWLCGSRWGTNTLFRCRENIGFLVWFTVSGASPWGKSRWLGSLVLGLKRWPLIEGVMLLVAADANSQRCVWGGSGGVEIDGWKWCERHCGQR